MQEQNSFSKFTVGMRGFVLLVLHFYCEIWATTDCNAGQSRFLYYYW